MKLIFLKPNIKSKNRAFIGKTGIIRFAKEFAKSNKFIKNENWLLGIDEEETINKNFYLLKAKDKEVGYKMREIAGNWSLNGYAILEKTKIEVPVKCNIEPIKLNGYEGFVLSIP